MYTEREIEILSKLASRPENKEWETIAFITGKISELDNIRKDGLVEFDGKLLKINLKGKKFLQDLKLLSSVASTKIPCATGSRRGLPPSTTNALC